MSRKGSGLFALGLLLLAPQASAIGSLTRVGSVSVPMYSGQAVTFAAPYAYVVSPNGLHVIDATNAAAPVLVTTLASAGGVDVARWGKYVLVGWGNQLKVVDVSNPPQPIVVSAATLSINAREIAVSGHHALAVGGSGMVSVDLSNPLAPVEVGTLAFPAQAEGIAISGNHAFVADREGGLRVVDISRPAAPTAVTVLDLGNLVFDVDVSGTYAYVSAHGYWCDEEYCGDTPGALYVVDVLNPASPRVVGTLSRPRGPENVFVYGRHVYFIERWVSFSDMRDRVIVADASNPAAPIDVAQYFPVWDSTGMAAAGPHVFVPENTSVTVLRAWTP